MSRHHSCRRPLAWLSLITLPPLFALPPSRFRTRSPSVGEIGLQEELGATDGLRTLSRGQDGRFARIARGLRARDRRLFLDGSVPNPAACRRARPLALQSSNAGPKGPLQPSEHGTGMTKQYGNGTSHWAAWRCNLRAIRSSAGQGQLELGPLGGSISRETMSQRPRIAEPDVNRSGPKPRRSLPAATIIIISTPPGHATRQGSASRRASIPARLRFFPSDQGQATTCSNGAVDPGSNRWRNERESGRSCSATSAWRLRGEKALQTPEQYVAPARPRPFCLLAFSSSLARSLAPRPLRHCRPGRPC